MKLYTFVVSLPGNVHLRTTTSCSDVYSILFFAAPLALSNPTMEKLTITETNTGKLIVVITP